MATGGRSLGIFYSGEEAGANRVGGRKMSTKAILISQLQSQFPRRVLGTSQTIQGGEEGRELHAHPIISNTELRRFLRFVDAVGGKEEGEGRKGEDSMIT